MKTLLLSLLFALPALAQDGFRNENGNLIWEHIYPATADMQATLDRQPQLQVITFYNDTYIGEGNNVKNTCGGAVLMKNDCKFNFKVQKANGNYIVTVTNLIMIEKFGPMQARVVESRCEKYLVDVSLKVKKDVRSQNDINCLNKFLTALFGGTMANAAMTAN